MTANPESEWFGYSRVDPADKTSRVHEVFSSVADKYDLMNDLMSGGLHRLWKDKLVRRMNPQAGQTILDVAGGTGDVALRLAAKTNGEAQIIVCDINPDMLKVGREKALNKGWFGESPIRWVAGNAEALPFEKRSVDRACIAFGLRNVTRIDTALAEFFRVLKPGGRFFCMEFSPGVRPILKSAYDAYSFTALPFLGRVIADNEEAYRYLAESIRQFPDQPTLAARMKKVGFEQVQWTNIMGGIAAIHEGWKL
jgi:demethylmenaquinone methyltransferase/2-methoxy-6-polyprenyl-1,4-benzoquinol methylase